MKTLLLVVALLSVANAAMADHIGIYADASGFQCQLAPGFTTSVAIVHKFSAGTVGSQFGISAANAPGSTIIAINSPYASVCVNPPCPYLYGECKTGWIVVGTLIAQLGSTGYLEIVGVGNNPTPVAVDCNQGVSPTTGGRGWLSAFPGGECSPGDLPVESSTWGSVKALYR